MKISQLEPNTPITIESTKENLFLSFDSSICELSSQEDITVVEHMQANFSKIDFCFVNGIHEEEFLLDYTSDAVQNDLVVVIDDKPWAWKNVRIMNMTLPVYGRIHVVMTTSGELPHNRRGNFRMEIDKPCEYNILGDTTKYQGVVQDISASGIGILVTDIKGISENTMLQINFTDVNKFYLTATVKRIKELPPSKYLVGLEFDRPSDSISAYICKKQRDKHYNQRKRI